MRASRNGVVYQRIDFFAFGFDGGAVGVEGGEGGGDLRGQFILSRARAGYDVHPLHLRREDVRHVAHAALLTLNLRLEHHGAEEEPREARVDRVVETHAHREVARQRGLVAFPNAGLADGAFAGAVDEDIARAQAETALVRVVEFLRDLVAVFEGDGALLFRRTGVDVAGVAFLDEVALVAVAPKRIGTATNAVTRSCGVRAKKRSVSSKSG